VYGQAVITLLTAQNTRGVQGVFATPQEQVLAQVRSVGSDLGAKATKTGALGNAALVAALASELRRQRGTFGTLVVDPVLVSKHGHRLADDTVVGALVAELLPLASVVTPNRFEATAMTGIEVLDAATAELAIARLLATGAGAVVVKDVPGLGGDLLGTATGAREVFATPRQTTPHRHGSGCTFSAAVTARLARGDELRSAIAAACDYVSRAIASAPAFGEVGPLNHWA
jgi:hydroxymethylpyrimidine/phosphomethylpyrimidine kinase